MELFAFLLSVVMLPQQTKDRIYTHEEILCSYVYSTTRQWTLELKEQGAFHLKYSNERSGVTKKKAYTVIGTWVNKNDTIILSASPTLMNDCYFRTAQFVAVGENLKLVSGGNECLPQLFEYGMRLKAWDGHIF